MSELPTLVVPTPAIAADGAEGTVQDFAQQDASLIRLDQFRADPRFSGINGQGQTVVVLDTGINLDHPFFGADADHNGVADRVVYSFDFTGANSLNANDINGHGSNVASIVGSQDATYTGMAPGCNIIALKVLNDSGSGTSSDIEEALQWVAANRTAFSIVAVNMSLGDGTNSNSATPAFLLSDEIATLKNNNVAVVCASGNSYYAYQTQGVASPSSDPNAWSVGAVWDRDIGGGVAWSSGAIDFSTGPDRVISFSQRSTVMTTVFAPGGMIGGAAPDRLPAGSVTVFSGTSQATPHIAGLVADMQQLAVRTNGHLMSVDDLRSTMASSAATIFDGDNENDNVLNTNSNYLRVDALAWGGAILDKLFAGTAGHDTLTGTVVGDTIHGQGGNDTLDGGTGADTTAGGAGNDVYYVDNGSDQVIESAGEGNDTVYSITHLRLTVNVENLILQGGGDLQAYGNSDANTLTGNAGNNILDGDAGADAMLGGAGNDAYFVDNAGDMVFENAGAGNDVVFSTAHLRLAANVETLVLQGSADLQGYGNSDANAIIGNAGSNLLDGDAGADTMVGGAGNDVYYVDSAGGDAVIENVGEGNDAVFSTAHLRLTANVETLVLQGSADLQGYGNNLANKLYGNSGDNLLDGDIGADAMFGGAGNDVYFLDDAGDLVFENLNQGTDAVFATVSQTLSANVETLVLQGSGNLSGTGNALANSIYGNSGDDTLNGGAAADLLMGNAGNDTFVFNVGQGTDDVIVDFAGNNALAGDALQFVGYGAGATFTQNDATHWQINYNGGASHDVITFMNGASVDASDVVFV
jgi:Ca2+-binding RTX toxin-like protein